MEQDIVEQIMLTLRHAGEHKRLVSCQRFHALFDVTDSLVSRYAALLALDNGLAGNEFYVRFKRTRFGDYLAVLGSQMNEHSLKKKRCLVEAERARVFDNAIQQRQNFAATEAA